MQLCYHAMPDSTGVITSYTTNIHQISTVLNLAIYRQEQTLGMKKKK